MRLDALRQRDQYQWFVKNSLGGGVTWNKRLSWRVYCLTNSPSQRSHWEMLFCSPLASNHHTQPRYLLPSAGRIGSISTWQNTTRRLIRLKAIFFLSFFFSPAILVPWATAQIFTIAWRNRELRDRDKMLGVSRTTECGGSASISLLKCWSSRILRRKVRRTVSRSSKLVTKLESYKGKFLLEFGKC